MPETPVLYYLHTFHTVAQEQSFTRAGQRLNLSQPAVSAHIRTLERYFGAKLFEVRRRQTCLTAPARRCLGIPAVSFISSTKPTRYSTPLAPGNTACSVSAPVPRSATTCCR